MGKGIINFPLRVMTIGANLSASRGELRPFRRRKFRHEDSGF